MRYVVSFCGFVDLLSILPTYLSLFIPGSQHLLVIGAAMYLIEGPENGFTSIPRAMYWAIVTLRTVGYGDVTPSTVPGQMPSSALMILGYGIIAIPTGIVTAELTSAAQPRVLTTRTCPSCLREGHSATARYCSNCGEELLNSRMSGPTTTGTVDE